MKSLPVGLQSIEKIIKNDFVYVDKTGLLYDLVKKPGAYFLSRPRRFGKSLTCSTLEAIFQGKKELFVDLEISKKEYDWKQYPVVRIDFSGIAHQTINDIYESLSLSLDRVAVHYDVDISSVRLAKDKFKVLILALAEKYGPVVLIIDEYDKPILDHIYNEETAVAMREFMKNFYGVLKDAGVEANLRFLFVTGVSKFSKVSLFSELNNLKDLTLDEGAATLCGYTQKELEICFDEHIKAFAHKKNTTAQALLSELKKWYNGFQFSELDSKVYNPFSILNCLSSQRFANYWFSSGTPTFIIKYAQRNPELLQKLMMLETEMLTASDLEKLSVENYFENTIIIFQQAGYLTLTHYNNKTNIFTLGYPNHEIRLSMTEHILNYIAKVTAVKIATTEYQLRDALERDDINAFCATMKDFFIVLPHTIIVDREKFFQGVFYTIAKLIGATIDAEQATSLGFIDAVLEGENRTYVIEFKRNKNPDDLSVVALAKSEALAQIEDKKYFAKFKIQGKKPVTLVGMNFDYLPDSDVEVNWKIKEI